MAGYLSPDRYQNFLPKQASLGEFIWEIVACMVITGKRRSGLNIWRETFNQGTVTEDIIFTIWYKKAIK